MITRLYIDNYRCFVNFEHRPGRKELIVGRNGSGKSSLLDVLSFLRQFIVDGKTLDELSILRHRTRWLDQGQITFELEVELEESSAYAYRLSIEPWGEPPQARVRSESVTLDGTPILKFADGEVHIEYDSFDHQVTYEFDWRRSAWATVMPRKGKQALTRFKAWFERLFSFRLNPFNMGSRAEAESLTPNLDGSNIAAWYRHLLQSDPRANSAFLDSLRQALDGFNFLQLEPFGENVRLLLAEFAQAGNGSSRYYFNELSEGQRCLICLYAILAFVVAKGGTVIFDEPDNFLSLREIQPWLIAVSDIVEDNRGQAFIISHHPEIINQWAPQSGVQFIREGNGPVRVERFTGDPASCLSPAELVARGWERE